ENLTDHPIASVLPLMDDDALADLAEDLQQSGLQMPILLYQGAILDGRNRHRACLIAGVEPRYKELTDEWFAEQGITPLDLVLSLNVVRRHLNVEQKRGIAGAVLKQDPARSNRSVARQVGIDDKTVASVRRDLESAAEIPRLDKLGIPVPEAKLPVFCHEAEALRREALSLVRKLADLLSKCAASPAGAFLADELKKVRRPDGTLFYQSEHLVALQELLEQTAPHCCVCPFCLTETDPNKKGRRCSCCHGRDWVPARVFEKS